MKTLSLIIGMLLVLASHSFAQNDTDPDLSKKQFAADLSSLYRIIYTEYHKQVSNLLAQSVYVTNPTGAIHSEANKDSQVVKQTTSGETFQVLEETDAWYKVQGSHPYSGVKITGWVSRDQVSSALNILSNTQLLSEASLNKIIWSISKTKFDGIVDDLYQKAVVKATKIQEKWKNNSYIKIKGFDVEVSFPPGVTFTFEFK